jgi:glycine oxidase
MSESIITHSRPFRIAIAGAGASGLACAEALSRRGAHITLFSSGPAGQGALAASGGMLAAGFESAFEATEIAAFSGIAFRALSLWDDYAARIERETGQSIGYERAGSITPAYTPDDVNRLNAAAARAQAAGIEVEALTGEAARSSEPALAIPLQALEFPSDGQVDNRALGQALRAIVLTRGGVLHEDTPVIAVGGDADGSWVETRRGRERFDAVIVATGARLPQGLSQTLPRPTPVKGQMIAFDLPRAEAPRRIVRGLSIYLAAKPGGRLIAGATSEPGVDTPGTDDDAIARLADAARQVLPALNDRPVVERWSGVRPRVGTGLPVLGATEVANVFIATGGYRNGVLLAPAIGEALAGAVLDGALPDWSATLRPLAPGGDNG